MGQRNRGHLECKCLASGEGASETDSMPKAQACGWGPGTAWGVVDVAGIEWAKGVC